MVFHGSACGNQLVGKVLVFDQAGQVIAGSQLAQGFHLAGGAAQEHPHAVALLKGGGLAVCQLAHGGAEGLAVIAHFIGHDNKAVFVGGKIGFGIEFHAHQTKGGRKRVGGHIVQSSACAQLVGGFLCQCAHGVLVGVAYLVGGIIGVGEGQHQHITGHSVFVQPCGFVAVRNGLLAVIAVHGAEQCGVSQIAAVGLAHGFFTNAVFGIQIAVVLQGLLGQRINLRKLIVGQLNAAGGQGSLQTGAVFQILQGFLCHKFTAGHGFALVGGHIGFQSLLNGGRAVVHQIHQLVHGAVLGQQVGTGAESGIANAAHAFGACDRAACQAGSHGAGKHGACNFLHEKRSPFF